MKKIIALFSTATVAIFLTSSSGEVFGQGKKAGTKTGTIELVESKDGKFRISIRDSEGKYLAGSPVGHATEKEAREVAEKLKEVIATAKFVSKKSESEGEEKKGSK